MIAQLKSGKAEGCIVHGVGQAGAGWPVFPQGGGLCAIASFKAHAGQHGGVVFQIEVVVVNAMAGVFLCFQRSASLS